MADRSSVMATEIALDAAAGMDDRVSLALPVGGAIRRASSALDDVAAWLAHWERDRQAGLPPTASSLALVAREVDAARLAIAEAEGRRR